MKCGIYFIANVISGTIYVGRSSNICQRFRQHRHRLNRGTHQNPHLQSAWRRYGEHAFVFSIERLCSDDEIAACEIAVLAGIRASGRTVYNITAGGEGSRHTAESRRKISQSRKGIVHTREVIERIRAQNIGRVLSEEHKAKLKANSYWRGKPRPKTPEHRARLSQAAKAAGGRPHTEETKQKIRAAKMGHVVSQETRDKIIATKRRRLAEKQLLSQ